MELKTYQKHVIADLAHYLEFLNQTKNISVAYNMFWRDKGVYVGLGGMSPYQDIMLGVPNLCFKVPTGGGKTFLACNAIRTIFDALPITKTKVVVWLVPSDAILTQTVKCLKDTGHPYRQRIDIDFGGCVEVYTKQELLNGQNFNPTTVTEQLSIMVLSYDSFRGRKEALKAKQENSNLAEFAKVLGAPENPIEDADETALLQIINQLTPLVIVDESHHAKSKLSFEMLNNFNPCFVLELTATPKKESNIISYVDAMQLKRESMVKLPVVVYNRDSQNEVLVDAIDLRRKLEELAILEQAKTGRYIRPIVLFQAQPKNKENSTTFEKLRDRLVEIGIPANEIAIRTADVNELKNVELTSEDCHIRYIITVNALKEGWDCPFAYILATLANKTSKIDVEQILGRILRLPHTRQNRTPSLNMSYVLTASNDFKTTLDSIICGLNSAGFSNRDYRLANMQKPEKPDFPPIQRAMFVEETPVEYETGEGFLVFDTDTVSKELKARQNTSQTIQSHNGTDSMIAVAEQAGQVYEQNINQNDNNLFMENLSWEVKDKVPFFSVEPEFAEEIKELEIPQFFYKVPDTLFTEGCYEFLEKETLSEGFTLKGKSYDIDFSSTDSEMVWVDIKENEGSTPKVFKMSNADQQYFKEYFSKLPPKARVEKCKDIMHHQLNKLDLVDSTELYRYIDLVVESMTEEQLAAMEKAPLAFALKIKKKIESLLEEHYEKVFSDWIEIGQIECHPYYKMPQQIHPINYISTIGGSLYTAEEEMNELERDLIMELTARPNIRWWHRNIARQGFYINGFINHYPDIMIMTEKRNIIFVETKGEHLKNDDSSQKIKLGRAWQQGAGQRYRYYMVFRDSDNLREGAIKMSHFIDILEKL